MATKKQFNTELTLEERSEAAFDAEMGLDEEAPQPKKASPTPAMIDFLRQQGLNSAGQKPGVQAPNVKLLFEGNTAALNILMHGHEDVEFVTGSQDQSISDIKVRKSGVPEDVYDNDLDDNKLAWFIYFMHNAFDQGSKIPGSKHDFTIGDHYVQRCREIATGWNARPVVWLRETVFRLIREGKFLKGVAFPESRLPEHDDDNTAENIGLITLLELSTYQMLQGEARRHGIGPVEALCAGVKDAIDKAIFRR